ncbi:PLD nuclease N-terminal domain-containing protein [Mobilicoccus massiliensis]|uniref:PLD nuclease N-terminal domain-containing protein n=1 Tax=Mobilicoccus massiliensis TaxID=1522310 RepID=UPI00058C14BD|nr:PLD nuclease N-terminal domain-containing protein [Mobilicoccus massiliensis]
MLRVVAAVALLAFTVYTLIDCVQTEDSKVKGLPKLVWVFVILLFPLAGGAVWWIAGRADGLPFAGPQSRPQRGPQDRPPRRGPIGPDDDPDFLGRL